MKLKTCLWLALTILFASCSSSKKDGLLGDFSSIPSELLSSQEQRFTELSVSKENGIYFLQSIKKDGNLREWSDKLELKPVSKEKIKELFSPEQEKNVKYGLFLETKTSGKKAEFYFFKADKDESDELFKTGYFSCTFTTTSWGAPYNSRYPLYKLN
ncbi:hypothetical protein FVB32_05345 [Flagellimonas hymeniacidonis]|uniref:Lipoprotein n=1 Tax=Flagellimonas hymeniacidonis TaxID=2603628 RepID=A0A5C8V6I2_9FLAO|nr:hypothetical protein [Flagellimonas hymeniacidonis]TXN37714.1 hypothetical protein FVB32_05345 [Flagellimonas hymeniacidonis]